MAIFTTDLIINGKKYKNLMVSGSSDDINSIHTAHLTNAQAKKLLGDAYNKNFYQVDLQNHLWEIPQTGKNRSKYVGELNPTTSYLLANGGKIIKLKNDFVINITLTMLKKMGIYDSKNSILNGASINAALKRKITNQTLFYTIGTDTLKYTVDEVAEALQSKINKHEKMNFTAAEYSMAPIVSSEREYTSDDEKAHEQKNKKTAEQLERHAILIIKNREFQQRKTQIITKYDESAEKIYLNLAYINREFNEAIKSFGAKWVPVSIKPVPSWSYHQQDSFSWAVPITRKSQLEKELFDHYGINNTEMALADVDFNYKEVEAKANDDVVMFGRTILHATGRDKKPIVGYGVDAKDLGHGGSMKNYIATATIVHIYDVPLHRVSEEPEASIKMEYVYPPTKEAPMVTSEREYQPEESKSDDISENDLPNLNGSEKQVSWAESIRNQQLYKINALIKTINDNNIIVMTYDKQLNKYVEKNQPIFNKESTKDQKQKVIDILKNYIFQNNPSKFIENKDIFNSINVIENSLHKNNGKVYVNNEHAFKKLISQIRTF